MTEDRRGMDGKPTPRKDRCTSNGKEDLGVSVRCWGPKGHPHWHWGYYAGDLESWQGEDR